MNDFSFSALRLSLIITWLSNLLGIIVHDYGCSVVGTEFDIYVVIGIIPLKNSP
jgi:hypothetical protein